MPPVDSSPYLPIEPTLRAMQHPAFLIAVAVMLLVLLARYIFDTVRSRGRGAAHIDPSTATRHTETARSHSRESVNR